MSYIHSNEGLDNKISHRDIKPENLLIFRQKRDGKLVIKYADFDSSKQLGVDDSVNISTGHLFTKKYLDPNIDQKHTDRQQVMWREYQGGDVYASGCVLYEVLQNGNYLFEGGSFGKTLLKVENNDRSNLLDLDIDELAKNLIYTMTQKEPADRISAKESEEHLYFRDDNFHIQALKSINEALIGLDAKDPKSICIKDAFDNSFFMLYREEWQKLDFVIPEILAHSKYSSSLEAFLRYVRNVLVHTEQHRESLENRFGKGITPTILLRKWLAAVPRGLIHLYWFAQCHLGLDFGLPEKCVASYIELMAMEKTKLGGDESVKAIHARVCPKPVGAAAPVDERAAMQEQFDQCGKEILQILDRSESHFRNYKKSVKEWEKKRSTLEKALKTKEEKLRPQEEIEAAKNSLQAHMDHMEDKLALKWMLDARDFMRNPEKIQAS